MPFARKSLTDLRADVESDIRSAFADAGPLLRFSNVRVTGAVQAGMAHLHYGYLDWIAKQAVPFTADDEYLEGWAALKGVIRLPAVPASGAVTFSGAAGVAIPAGRIVARDDGAEFITTTSAVVGAGGQATVNVAGLPDPTGTTGLYGNTTAGASLTLAQTIPGVQSTGIVTTALAGGQDVEAVDSLRNRMLSAYQAPPQGGTPDDYVRWALAVPNVTRAWCKPHAFGVGTIVMYCMMDDLRQSAGGIPQGTAGVAAGEWRGVTATADLLTIANAIYEQQAILGLVYLAAPVPDVCNFTLQGVPPELQTIATGALRTALRTNGVPGGSISFGVIAGELASVLAGHYFTISPNTDIACATAHIPVLGNVTYL